MHTFKNVMICVMALGFAGAVVQSANAAATVTHIYDLNGSYADTLGGPSLVPNGGTIGATGYTFAPTQGLSLSNAINGSNYSIEMAFKFDTTSGYRKIIDFKNLTSDNGLYNLNTSLNFYPIVNGPAGAITAGTIEHVVLTRDGTTNLVTGYVNGVSEFSFTDSTSLAVFDGPNNIGNFLRDDFATGQNESSGGFLDQLRIYDGALTGTQVLSLFNGGTPPGLGAVPEPSQVATFAFGVLALGGLIISRRRRAQA